MHLTRRALLGAPALLAAPALAQSWPDRPIRIVVAFPAGSVTDTLIRHLSEPLAKELGQPVIIDNRPGGNGVVGTESAARAGTDGLTWCVLSVTNGALAPYVVRRLPYDPLKDFQPIGFLAETAYILVVRADHPARDLPGLIALAKEKPGALTFSYGNQSAHIASATLARMAGVEMTGIPYRGGPEALTDVIAGRIDSTFTDIPAGVPQIRDGKVRALGITQPEPFALLPEIPPVATMLPGYGFRFWFGMGVPTGTPPAIVARANAAMNAALGSGEFAERVARLGYVPRPTEPEWFRTFLAGQIRELGDRAREVGIEPG
ncbi:Bug family tripartite tricarboxylate transporter substrate binding protein [Paracraurococcus lichenis]|uniref:Tripartite tricarboxylate transporter substrate binding protein n=1 Tax=Paracraurococcus lichenis TaxID=3064888 RepID=A0ABT9DT38_9PROT|nr:tripartite tricarboxylate transporter substrate binding protein [Paracraurococcus sp. LOR1-02]MDO9707064.1 tripartite tricarboxylate transporter substrate binding protein [Paracraurococcus sp. LOR1-02]